MPLIPTSSHSFNAPLAAGLLLASLTNARATDISEFINVLSYRTVHTFGMDFDGPTNGDVDFTSSSLFALLGKVDVGDVTWVPAFSYDYAEIGMNALPFGANPAAPRFDDSLHRINIPNFLIYAKEDSRWFHGAFVIAGLQSDLDRINSRDIFLSAAVGSGYRISDTLTVGLGVFGGNITNDPFFVPAPVFFWTPTPDWLISYYGPRFVARRNLGDTHQIGVEGGWNGGSWSVDAFGNDARVDLRSLRLGAYYQYRFYKEAWLEIGAGYTIANELTLNSPGGTDLAPNALGELEPAPYLSIGVTIRRW